MLNINSSLIGLSANNSVSDTKNVANANGIYKTKLNILDKDCFTKSIENNKEVSIEERRTKLFNETYDEVIMDMIKNNPIIKELNLPKPKVNITNFNNDSQGASYNFETNTINISKNYEDSDYYFYTKNEDGSISYIDNLSNSEDISDCKKYHQKKYGYKNIEVVKLTPEEKDLNLKSIFAHELRHYVQKHLIASTEGTKDAQFEICETRAKNMEHAKNSYIKACKNEGKTPDNAMLNIEIPNYHREYKPKKLLANNVLLKFSQDKNDNRYLSVSDHLFHLSESLMSKNRTEETYYGRPMEIDAYNYQCEYIKKFSTINNIRPEVASLLIDDLQTRGVKNGIKYMNNYGYDFIYKD